ncbi:MAG TPA: glycosyltransferase family 4 protein [Acidimicrobiia bacterium]|jgi:glycosyltransferase involved in cell wall biosynthesis
MIRPRRERASGRTRPVAPDHDLQVAKLGDIAGEAGIERVSILAWRDLDDPEAGGSERHAANVAALWAEAGIEVTMRTSYAANRPMVSWRDGYRVIRKAGRYLVFPRAAFSEMMGWHGGRDGLVEIWNGMPFFSPVWARTPHVTWLHHVHAEMWRMTLPPRLAALGNFIESRFAPPLYRHTPIVTLSESSKREIVDDLHFPDEHVTVVPPGIDPQYTPGGKKSSEPLVVAVGRLVPVKRYDMLVDALVPLKARHPGLRAVIVGEGYCRPDLEAQIRAARAEDWISLPGRVSDDDVIGLYRRAWVLAMTSSREGWGMIVTEAAACRTPSVVTRVPGFVDAVVEGETGLLVDSTAELTSALDTVLGDAALRDRLGAAAAEQAGRYTWEATARGTLEVLAQAAIRRRAGQ